MIMICSGNKADAVSILQEVKSCRGPKRKPKEESDDLFAKSFLFLGQKWKEHGK